MYKKIFLFSLVLLMCLTFAFSVNAASQPIVIKVAHSDIADDSWGSVDRPIKAFKQLVETRSDGRLKVEIYPNMQLGSEREMYESLMMGTIQMTAACASAPLSSWIPEVSILSLPYLFKSSVIATKVLDGDFGRDFNKLLIEKTGIRFLGHGYTGYRNFTNNVRPIKTPEDMKGLKIRVMEDPAYVRLVKALGASPTPISWGEVYTSLHQGVVDGQENPNSVILIGKLYEVQKYLTLDGHTFNSNPISINEKFYQSLPDDLKYIVYDSLQLALKAFRGFVEFGDVTGVQDLISKGMTVYSPSQAELSQFKEVAQGPVIESLAKEIGNEWIDKLIGAIEQAEKEYASEIK